MRKISLTHRIIVSNNKFMCEAADGYAEEVKVFTLSQEEYDELRRDGGLFDLFDDTFGTIIDDCEEDRLSSDQVIQAVELTKSFLKADYSNRTSGAAKVLESLVYAEQRGVFWEIDNSPEISE